MFKTFLKSYFCATFEKEKLVLANSRIRAREKKSPK